MISSTIPLRAIKSGGVNTKRGDDDQVLRFSVNSFAIELEIEASTPTEAMMVPASLISCAAALVLASVSASL